MKKTLFLSAILATALCSSAFGDVSYTTSDQAQLNVGKSTSVFGGADVYITLNLETLKTAAAGDLITISTSGSNWGLATRTGGIITGSYGSNHNWGSNTTAYDTLNELDTDHDGKVTLYASITNNGTYLKTQKEGGTTLYDGGSLKESGKTIYSYNLTNSGAIESAVIAGNEIRNISGSGRLTLTTNSYVNGGNQGGDVDMIISRHGVIFTGDTTLKSVGADTAAGSGITVSSGVTLTSSIISSWNPGDIKLGNNASIVADKIQLATNATSNLTGGTGASVTAGSLNTFHGAKLVSSVATFHVTGDVDLGANNPGDGQISDILTIAGGTFTVDGSVNIRTGRTLRVTGGTVVLNGAVTADGTFTNNATVNLNVAHGSQNDRTANGYETTHDVLTFAGTGTVGGTGTWKINNTVATLDQENRTLSADVITDSSSYYVDKTDAEYDASLKDKYIIAEGINLTVSGNKTWVKVKENNGTLVLSGMNGFFSNQANLGNVQLEGTNALTLTDGFSKSNSGVTKMANLSGTGTINTSNDKNPDEYFEVTGDVASTVSFNGGRTNASSKTTFVFSKAGVDNVTIGDVTNTTATLSFEANALTVNSLTLNSGTVGVYAIGAQHTEANEVTLTTSSLTVNGNANLIANLVVSGGTISFANNTLLTMGSSVTIGTGDTVTVELTEEMVQAIKDTGRVDLFTSVETATLGNHIVFTGANGAALEQADVYALNYDGSKIYVTPEPATATLSLLALAGLMARRRRH